MKKRIDFYQHAVAAMATAGVYCGHGTDCYEDEAWWLIASSLNLPISGDVDALLDQAMSEIEWQRLEQVLQRRTQDKVPLAYLLNEAYQNGYKFYVDQHVLIPRSPIAELLNQQVAPWVQPGKVSHILDLCTGSACLAILAAHAFPEAQVTGSDLSEAAIATALKNVALHGLDQRMQIVKSDVFDHLAEKQYDMIISNPPYVDQIDLDSMPMEYQHEPRMALAAGADGLDIVRRILKQAKAHLKPQGILIVEVGNSAMALEAAFPHLPFIWLDFEFGGEGVFLLRTEDL